ncbi:hypothetical protein BC936DRAFT_142335 [Jimgerdemannia flammicorona]|uniref:Uncharacterized protein n=2 Tax=Jimgerdemannia flammicorona TaxID=994334 RepID=A0A433DFD4_9FUNG|nr:hypothetical protein BC936DRAFT_142335 [Jimgerdemannia flammicorona]RUS28940.1 hypothetical protein BC938DRAFT_481250 [Jimgerdemannia flammicorona]
MTIDILVRNMPMDEWKGSPKICPHDHFNKTLQPRHNFIQKFPRLACLMLQLRQAKIHVVDGVRAGAPT